MFRRILTTGLLIALSMLGVAGQEPEQSPLVKHKDQLESIKEGLNSVVKDVLGNEPLDPIKVAEQDGLARQLWQLYDSEVIRALDTHKQVDESALNQFFTDALDKLVKRGTGPEITCYGLAPGPTRTWIVRYRYDYGLGGPFIVTTFHWLSLVDGKYRVVAKAEDTDFYLALEPQHRQGAKLRWQAMNWEAGGRARHSQLRLATIPLIQKAIDIRMLPRRQKNLWRFLTTHEGHTTGPQFQTMVEWEWDGKRLEVISWIWNDEWEFNEIGDPTVGILHSQLPDRDGKKVKYEELFKAGPTSDFPVH